MYKLFLALRYLRAHKIVYFCIAGVAVGIAVMTIVTSVMGGFSKDVRQRIRGMQSDLTIYTYRYQTGSADYFIDDYPMLVDELRKIPQVRSVSPRLEFGAQVTSGGGSRENVLVVGIDPAAEATTSELAAYFSKGSKGSFDFNGAKSGQPGIVVGSDLRYRFSDSRLITLWTARPGTNLGTVAIRNRSFEVLGTFKTMMNDYDDHYIFMSLEEAQSYLLPPNAPPLVNQIAIQLNDFDADLRAVVPPLESALSKWQSAKKGRLPLMPKSWMQAKQNLIDAVAVEKVLQIIIMFCIIIVAGFNIIAIYDLLVRSKHRDIGIIKALGATTGGIANIYLLSGVLCGLIGSLIGTAMGLLLSYQLNHVADFIEYITHHISYFSLNSKVLHFGGAVVCAVALCVLKFYYGRRQDRPLPIVGKLLLLPVFVAAAASLIYAAWIVLGALPWESVRQPARYAFAGIGGAATLVALGRRRGVALASAFDVACLVAGIGLLLLLANSLLTEVSDPRYASILRNSFYAAAGLYVFVCGFWVWRWIQERRAPVESTGPVLAPATVAFWALFGACCVAAVIYGSFLIFNPAPGYTIEIFPKRIYGLERIPSTVDYGAVTFIVVSTLVASLAASIYPAVRAARRSPIESIRYE